MIDVASVRQAESIVRKADAIATPPTARDARPDS
jgi:hypothetical protein